MADHNRRPSHDEGQVRETLRGPAPAGWAEEPLHRMIGRAAAILAKAGSTPGASLVIATDATPWALRDLGPGRFSPCSSEHSLKAFPCLSMGRG